MAASRSRWPVTACTTGRGGKGRPGIVEVQDIGDAGVSARREEMSSITA
jgi:hypothetical protein